MSPKRIPLIALALFALLAIVACEERPVMDASVPPEDDSAAMQTYSMTGVIVGRDAAANSVTVDHEAIGDWMGAMTMSFPMRGGNVADLPADGTAITATVNVDGADYWLSDVTAGAPAATPEAPVVAPTETTTTTTASNNDM